jgi:transposase
MTQYHDQQQQKEATSIMQDQLISLLCVKALTVEQICDLYDISEATAHRWLNMIEERGWPIYRIGTKNPSRYVIIGNTDSDATLLGEPS